MQSTEKIAFNFDAEVKALQFEAKAKPTDRIKSEEELASEQVPLS